MNIIVTVVFVVTAVPTRGWVPFVGNRPRFFPNDALTDASIGAIIWLFDGKCIENNRKETSKKILRQGCRSQDEKSFQKLSAGNEILV
jgi:hypothetical protein